ncbi:MAG: hypothetical protein H7259_05070 [Cytophagales bacterium]|nr:hypothetical protein [Cytophaga sp.]
MDIKEYFKVSEVFTYFFRKKDPNNKPSFNLRMMHGTNKISMLIFLIGVLIIIYKTLIR